MSMWAERAKARFSQTPPERTDETDKTPLSSVLSVPSQHLCEKTEDAKGTFVGFVGSYLVHPEKTALPATAPDWTPPPPAPDPGLPRLLALAMALCDRTGASEQARRDWRADIEQAAPQHRGGLLHLIQRLMRDAKSPAVVSPVAAPAPSEPPPKFHSAQPWNVADRIYQAHHWSCTTCKAAARSGHSERCTTGQHLHQLYEQAFEATKEST